MSDLGNEAKAIALNSAATLIMDHQLWYDAKMFVQAIAGNSNLTKEEKHKEVFDKLLVVFGDIGQTLLDVAIKIAVLWLSTQGIQNIHAPSEAL